MAYTWFSRRQPRPQRDRHNEDAPTWGRSRHDEVNTYKVDIAEELDDSETASSLSIADRVGMTVDSSSVTSAGLITVTISAGGDGHLRAKVTTSDSRVLVFPMQWRRIYSSQADPYR